MSDSNKDSLLEFPCEFPIKMMGRASDEFREIAVALVEKHASEVPEEAISVSPSRNGNFVSVTVTIVAQSQQQLDNIYLDLTSHEAVLVAL